jgi:hypothetical protein
VGKVLVVEVEAVEAVVELAHQPILLVPDHLVVPEVLEAQVAPLVLLVVDKVALYKEAGSVLVVEVEVEVQVGDMVVQNKVEEVGDMVVQNKVEGRWVDMGGTYKAFVEWGQSKQWALTWDHIPFLHTLGVASLEAKRAAGRVVVVEEVWVVAGLVLAEVVEVGAGVA